MEYRAVKDRCALALDSLQLPFSTQRILAILASKGFKVVEVDLITLARECIGNSHYRRGAKPSEAPGIMDCSSFTKWLYGKQGIWLPRRSIQQRELGEIVNLDKLITGDLVFVSGWIDWYLENPADGVGHVGIATGCGTIVHAANKKVGIIESPLKTFAEEANFRGARRYIPKDHEVITFETPPDREIEIADDFRWILLQSLPKTKLRQ